MTGGGGECTPVISGVWTPHRMLPLPAHAVVGGGGVCLRARTPCVGPRAWPPSRSPQSPVTRTAGPCTCVFTWGGGGGTPGLYPLTWPLGLCFALQLFYFYCTGCAHETIRKKNAFAFWELGVLTNKNQYAKQMVACQKKSVANLRFVLHWTLGKSVCVATSPRRPMGNVLHEP